MLRQIKLLAAIRLCNLCRFNEIRHCGDAKRKKRYYAMTALWVFLGLYFFAYLFGQSYLLSSAGMGRLLPLIMHFLILLIILFFDIFQTGSALFGRERLDHLFSMPVHESAILFSRYLSLYVTDLLLSALIMIPSLLAYGIWEGFTLSAIVYCLLGILFLPMIPLAIASIFGGLFTALTSRMKHKNIAMTLFAVLFVMGIFYLQFTLTSGFQIADEEMLLASVLNAVGKVEVLAAVYPPAAWFAEAVIAGHLSAFLAFALTSVAATALVIFLFTPFFKRICNAVNGSVAGTKFRMNDKAVKKQSVLVCMVKREAKRYAASGIYVTNTIIGFVMLAAVGIAIGVLGIDSIMNLMGMPFPKELGIRYIPLIFSLLGSLMVTTPVAVSIEGKQWWIYQTLPITEKDIEKAKILFGLLLAFPFYAIAVVATLIRERPDFLTGLVIVLVPAIFITTMHVLGYFMGAKLANFEWENETKLVKQSAVTAFYMLAVLVAFLLMLVPLIVFNDIVDCRILYLLFSFLLLILCAVFYKFGAGIKQG